MKSALKEISYGVATLPEGWKAYKSDCGQYFGHYIHKTPFSKTKYFDDRFELRRYIIEVADKRVNEYITQLDLRFKSIYLPTLTMHLMSFYSSDIENLKFMRHNSKKFQNILKRAMNNYLTVVESECKQFGVYDMVDFLSEKFNDHVFSITEEALDAIRQRLSNESNREDICKTIMVNILAQTIACRNDIFKLKNEKSLRDIIWASNNLMVEMFNGAYVVDLNRMDVYPMISKMIQAMNSFQLSRYINEYEKNKNKG